MIKNFLANTRQKPPVREERNYVIRSSICTGEKVAGYLNENGKFVDIMLIQSEADLKEFCKQYGVKKEDLKEVF